MAWRDKNIEDLTERYAGYLRSLDSETLAFLADDVELLIEPKDEISPLIEEIEVKCKEAAEAEAYEAVDAFRMAVYILEGAL